MNPSRLARLETALLALPNGSFTGASQDRRYIVTKSLFNAGKSMKLVAEELGGADYISLNFYRLARGSRLFPCEMSVEKVTDFILDLRPHPVQAEA
ncbi:hypothetical protein ROLI_031150 [Roseobacter fucihabitans]|uniref:Peptide methionine sulfoxide reductase n=1 Tax=Roseobacter fucihabitans TaxID=1537242 RepID=A0ABZ2BZ79_9RHOB|nr:hypothetical protein [Roseobacter litoralis]MBC6967172.1 hypothetical protein [Roseobacter litoralis]